LSSVKLYVENGPPSYTTAQAKAAEVSARAAGHRGNFAPTLCANLNGAEEHGITAPYCGEVRTNL